MSFQENLIRARKARSMTQEEMVERCAVTRQSIPKWEADIALPETEKLSAALCKGGRSQGQLVCGFQGGG